MNRMILLLFVGVLSLIVVSSVYAQTMQPLTVSHVEVSIDSMPFPEMTWWQRLWSYVGIRSTVKIRPKEGTVLHVVSSAYASSPYQTDSTPCVTAAGTRVRPGVVATNFLPLGTIVEIAGQKYIVEDRMNARYAGYYLDIWFPSTSAALEFGRKKLDITIVAYDEPGTEVRATPSPQIAENVPRKTVWQSVTSSVSSIGDFLFTRTYDPNKYDVDCSQ